jgi:hypothetical protein
LFFLSCLVFEKKILMLSENIVLLIIFLLFLLVLFFIKQTTKEELRKSIKSKEEKIAGCGIPKFVSCHQKLNGPKLFSFDKEISTIFDLTFRYPQIQSAAGVASAKQKYCQLSNNIVCKFRQDTAIGKMLEKKITSLFEDYIAMVPGVEISSFNLFHCHFIFSTTKKSEIILLFHAFEYPKDSPTNLGYCQIGSNVSLHNPNYKKRNAICVLDIDLLDQNNQLQIINCPSNDQIFCTRYAEEFGQEVGEIICVKNGNQLELFYTF